MKKAKNPEIRIKIKPAYVLNYLGNDLEVALTKKEAEEMVKKFKARIVGKKPPVVWEEPLNPPAKIRYALFSADIPASEKYNLTTPPSKFFPTREAAHAWAKKQGWKRSDYKVMTY